LTYTHFYAIIRQSSIVLAHEKKDGDRVTLDTPLSVSIRIYGERSPAIAAALKLMLENRMKPDGLIEAFLAGISAKYYVEARLLGHTHEEVMERPLFVSPVYINLRIKQGLTVEQATEVWEATTSESSSFYGRRMRGAYRAAHKAGFTHDDCVLAMHASRRRLSGRAGGDQLTFEEFLKRAISAGKRLGEQPTMNEVWRAWLTANNQEPYDISEA
jgi:hypothetical protein